ncbi:hypothetical protein HD554DRAFT_2035511 [Boletus coccyginus]|nr:hypothetical protein HD554DRAFT_2035511 [Boletus coccyginus]
MLQLPVLLKKNTMNSKFSLLLKIQSTYLTYSNRAAIFWKMKVKYQARHAQVSSKFENKLCTVEGKLLGFISGSLKCLLDSWLLTPTNEGTLDSSVEELILLIVDVQKGAMSLLTSVQKVTRSVARAISMLEDVLMANMEGTLHMLYQKKVILTKLLVLYQRWANKAGSPMSRNNGFTTTTSNTTSNCQKQLLNAMWWKANTWHDKWSASIMDPFKSMNQLMKDSMKWMCNLSKEQVYSKLYYKDKIKPMYEEECVRLDLSTSSKKEHMGVHHRLTKESWDESAKDEQQ